MTKVLAVFLCGAWSASAAPPLQDVLRRTGQAVEVFWTHFAAVNCTESLLQSKLDQSGKPVFKRQVAFDYLAVPAQTGRDLAMDESRLESKAAPAKKKDVPLLVTDGFPTLLLIFHPRYQDGYEYGTPVEDEVAGRTMLRVDFRQAAGGRSPSCLKLRGHEYPLPWAGSAWIDRLSGDIVRIVATLMPGMEDLGFRNLSADVSYAPVRFNGEKEAYWLPAAATIDAQTAKQRWHNEHRFLNYKLFQVSTSSEIGSVK